MRSWMDLGVVDTIYEEEQEECSTNSSSSSLDTSSHHSLQTRVEIWSQATGLEPNVVILVQGRRFHLHKDPLTAGSGYLKRQLGLGSCATVPSTITPETFATVAASFYGHDVLITPFNVTALRIAAELLDAADDDDDDDDDVGNLKHRTEEAFRRLATASREYAEVILQSCLTMMPEAEETACLASRCIEALLALKETGDAAIAGDGWIDGVTALTGEEFQLITDSLRSRLTVSHDLLYKIVSLYLKENGSKLPEAGKNRIAGAIDCNKLSHEVLMHAVQNPNMPLRFVVQVMLAEHFNTRRSVFSATESAVARAWKSDGDQVHQKNMTLGALLQRDAALRHVAQLKAAMEATSERIQSLESDLVGMKKRLHESERRREALEAAKSASFRFSSEEEKQITTRREEMQGNQEKREGRTWRKGKSLGRKLVAGLKSVFGTSVTESRERDCGSGEDAKEEEQHENPPCHRRSRSLV